MMWIAYALVGTGVGFVAFGMEILEEKLVHLTSKVA